MSKSRSILLNIPVAIVFLAFMTEAQAQPTPVKRKVTEVEFLNASTARLSVAAPVPANVESVSFNLRLSKAGAEKLRESGSISILDPSGIKLNVSSSFYVSGPSTTFNFTRLNVKVAASGQPRMVRLEYETEEVSIALRYVAVLSRFGKPASITPRIRIGNSSGTQWNANTMASGFGIPDGFYTTGSKAVRTGSLGPEASTVILTGRTRIEPTAFEHHAVVKGAELTKAGTNVAAKHEAVIKSWPSDFKDAANAGELRVRLTRILGPDIEHTVAASSYVETVDGKAKLDFGKLQLPKASSSAPILPQAAFSVQKVNASIVDGIVKFDEQRITDFRAAPGTIDIFNYEVLSDLNLQGLKAVKGMVTFNLRHVPRVIETKPTTVISLKQPAGDSVISQLTHVEKLLTELTTPPATADPLISMALASTHGTISMLKLINTQRDSAATERKKVIDSIPVSVTPTETESNSIATKRAFWDTQLSALAQIQFSVISEYNEAVVDSRSPDFTNQNTQFAAIALKIVSGP